MSTSTNCVWSNALVCLKNNILETLRTQIFTKEESKSVKLIFYLANKTSPYKKNKISDQLHPFVKTVSAKTRYFGKKQAFSNLWEIKYSHEKETWQ